MSYIPYHYIYRIIFIGDAGVGKTALTQTLINDSINPTYVSTIGIDFVSTLSVFINDQLKETIIKSHIWDTAGQEYFFSVVSSYFRNTIGICVVYDVTNRQSFEHIEKWLQRIKEYAPKNVFIALIANKIDLKRKISKEEGETYAKKNNLLYFETNVRDILNTRLLYKEFIEHIFKNIGDEYHVGVKKYLVDDKQDNFIGLENHPPSMIDCCTLF